MKEKQAKIKELLEKGVENIYPTKKFLEDKLKSGEKLTIYLGIDPTGPELHIGHSIPLMKLRAFQDLGHKIILLIGNFTALCGGYARGTRHVSSACRFLSHPHWNHGCGRMDSYDVYSAGSPGVCRFPVRSSCCCECHI